MRRPRTPAARQAAEEAGRRGERLAGWWLRLKGWRVLDRRVRTPAGEVDLVARKGALVAFTKAFAHEAIKRGVRVNAVAPGPIWTPLIPATMSPEKVQAFGKQAPIGRAGQPAELAPIYVLLASDESSYVVGAIYAVTGGMITA